MHRARHFGEKHVGNFFGFVALFQREGKGANKEREADEKFHIVYDSTFATAKITEQECSDCSAKWASTLRGPSF